MIHYHGTPITPESAAAQILAGRHAMVSFAEPRNLELVADVCQSFTFDNGAFSAWKLGKPILDWSAYYRWVKEWSQHPAFDFALIPDVITGDERENAMLIAEWPFSRTIGCPIWHLHESTEKLLELCREWPRVALGSSGRYATIGTSAWWNRMAEGMAAVCPDGKPLAKLHGLRMLNPEIFTRFPFASADSTNVARNIGIDGAWRGTYLPSDKAVRGLVLAERIESHQSSPIWNSCATQPLLMALESEAGA